MSKIKFSLLLITISITPYLALRYIKVMDISLGAFIGEWCYAHGLDYPAKVFNNFACQKGETLSCSLLEQDEGPRSNL